MVRIEKQKEISLHYMEHKNEGRNSMRLSNRRFQSLLRIYQLTKNFLRLCRLREYLIHFLLIDVYTSVFATLL